MLEFTPFSEHKAVRIYRTNLPHWRQDGCTYFVTFRLADSIPKKVLDDWQREKATWLAVHGIEMDQGGQWMTAFLMLPDKQRFTFENIFNRKLNEYLDRSHGSCLMAQPSQAQTLKDKLLFFDRQRYQIGDYVVMPNHVHALIRPGDGHELEKILQSIKKESARAINRALAPSGRKTATTTSSAIGESCTHSKNTSLAIQTKHALNREPTFTARRFTRQRRFDL